jgi:hypothetical protein
MLPIWYNVGVKLCHTEVRSIYGRKWNFIMTILTLDLVDGLGEAADVLAGNTRDRDTAVLGGIDRVLSSLLVYRSR